jgi:Peptidase A4 family
MRTIKFYAVFFALALILAGCSRPGILRNLAATSAVPTATASSAANSATSATAPATSSTPADASATTPAANDPALAAIKATVEKANQEQVDAFTKNDPTPMKDTATSSYYDELVKINQDMVTGGVSAIKLVTLEWGPITLPGATTANVTTFETWQTQYTDGSTDESRDRNVYTLIKDQGAWKIQTDDHPDSPTAPSSTTAPAPSGSTAPAPSGSTAPAPSGSTAPAPSGSVRPRTPGGSTAPIPSLGASQTDISRNWSGYQATGGSYTTVSATWAVPQSTSSSTGTLATEATWVGIGGVTSKDLIQAGTEETTSGTSTVHYDAWIEMLPAASHPIKLTVAPGDSVSVAISEQGTDSWLIAFKNNTTGQTYQTTVKYTSSLSSAEWVVEAPSSRRQILPLDNFGTIAFSAASATKDGKSVNIAQAAGKPITLMARGGAAATPSALTASGDGFTVTRNNSATTNPLSPLGGSGRGRGGFGIIPKGMPAFPLN